MAQNSRFSRELLSLFDSLTRTHDKAFPMIVLEAADDGVDIDAYLDSLAKASHDALIPSTTVTPGADAEDAELQLVNQITDDSAWREVRPPGGRFRFPRSNLVRSFDKPVEEAAKEASEEARRHGWTDERRREYARDLAVQKWSDAAPSLPWSRQQFQAPGWLKGLGLLVLALIDGGVVTQVPKSEQLIAGMVVLGVMALLVGLTTRQVWLPILSRIGFGTRYRWFAASSYFAVLGGGTGFYDRLYRVFHQLVGPKRIEFHVQLKAFALFEDLRAEHRKLSLSLRGYKRPTVPVLFLKDITKANGGIDMLSAMSDIRSRRSELHPLLVIASVDYAHRHELDQLAQTAAKTAQPAETPASSPADEAPAVPALDDGETVDDRYASWEDRLGTAQSPSQRIALPYLLRLPIPFERPDGQRPASLARRRRPRWTWLWSWQSLVTALAVVVAGGSYLNDQLTTEYCQVNALFFPNPDAHLFPDKGVPKSHECVGVATHGLYFETGKPKSMGLDGNLRPPSSTNHGAQTTLHDLQDKIAAENRKIANEPHVATILYAGMLTAANGNEENAVSSIRQLAGAYLAQMRNNEHELPNEDGTNPVKIRLLPVNLGQNMNFSKEAVDSILAMARHNRSIIGVVGMERNTEKSYAQIKRLSDAGLAVIDTANSSDVLPTLRNYYGVVSTDHDEAVAARYEADKLFTSSKPQTLIVSRDASRDPRGSRDQYSAEQAADVSRELSQSGYHPHSITYSDDSPITGQIAAQCGHYGLVYFAGREEDLPGLFTGLENGQCKQPLTLMGGDEVARARFGNTGHSVHLPSNVTVYYTIFTYLPNDLKPGSNNWFVGLTQNVLLGSLPLDDGQTVVTFDATIALALAAQQVFAVNPGQSGVPGSQTVTSGGVLLALQKLRWKGGVTGTIDFTHDQHHRNGAGNRGLTLVQVANPSSGQTTKICGRMNGGGRVPGLRLCES